MYIVKFKIGEGHYGPFKTHKEANGYLALCKAKGGRVIALIKPYAFGIGKPEADDIEAAVTLASEHGGT